MMRSVSFPDWGRHLPEGSNVAFDMLSSLERLGGDPRRWLQEWLRDRGIGNRERTAIEMRVLIDSVMMCGSYDQLNLVRSSRWRSRCGESVR